ncbi:hypothetical protein LMG19282_01453 [Cupriavidus campinensis]|uniref:Uncharacterized protein n=1 Tax=Cupriavidus campinensis TaxID=151783 RepID=A0ABY3EJB2_9BURK|nr:hypothetical protein [Cupriavidus campinensis]TSP11020.1 hypothetical protein FGG12_19350 [Cupriavidus campinensis]CAG2138153.1 hypothetical protein LMG19282_01453 [Cupriavidus campinensis]
MAFSAPAQWEVRILHILAASEFVFKGTHMECASFMNSNKQRYAYVGESNLSQVIYVRDNHAA